MPHTKPRADLARFAKLMLLAGLLAPGAAPAVAAPPVQDLQPKRPKIHDKDGFSAIVFWRARIEDRTGDLRGHFPRFVVGPPGAAAHLRSGKLLEISPKEYFSSYGKATAVEGHWSGEGPGTAFDGLFAVEARPGSYEWFQFALDRRSSGIGDSAGVLTLSAAACTVGAGALIYLGELRITVAGRKSGTNEYDLKVEPGAGDASRDRAALLALVPTLLAGAPAEASRACTIGRAP